MSTRSAAILRSIQGPELGSRAFARVPEPLGLPDTVLTGFLRLVTNRKIFSEPAEMSEALSFTSAVRQSPNSRTIRPSSAAWDRFAAFAARDPYIAGQSRAGRMARQYCNQQRRTTCHGRRWLCTLRAPEVVQPRSPRMISCFSFALPPFTGDRRRGRPTGLRCRAGFRGLRRSAQDLRTAPRRWENQAWKVMPPRERGRPPRADG